MSKLIPNPLPSPRIHRTAPVPRTLEQAFGPYARSSPIVPMAESRADYERGHKVATLTAIAVGFIVLLIVFTEWLATS